MHLAVVLGVVVAPVMGAAPDPGAPAPATLDGKALVERFECNRCHSGPQLAEPEPDKACVGCHAAIEAGTFEAPADVLHRWQEHIIDLTAVPSLAGIGQRLQRGWVADYLLRSNDLRPSMRATMPRFDMDADEARAIAKWLIPDDEATADEERWLSWPSRGRRVLETRGCATCHQMTGVAPLQISKIPVELDKEQLERGVMLAPDFRHTRTRFKREALVAWLLDPPAQKPDTPMPKLNLSRFEAEDAAAYLLEAPLGPVKEKPVPKRLEPLDRRVTFKEVSDAVFKKVCWHCHSEPDLALGDGGPGNTGGFGFEGRRVNLRDYASVMAGGLDDNGERKSLFRDVTEGPLEGTPRLLAHLLARQIEEAGGAVNGIRGMPLGLPSMPPEAIQLVETWIAQGRPE